MRAVVHRLGPVFILLLGLLVAPEGARAADKYWVGGPGIWNDPTRWAATPGGVAGAGVPSSNDDVFMGQDVSADDTISFIGDGSADNLRLVPSNGRFGFDLDGHRLRVLTNVTLGAAAGDTNLFVLSGGELGAWNLESNPENGGDTEIVVAPDANVEVYFRQFGFPGADQEARVISRGQGARIRIEGLVRLNDSVTTPAHPFVEIVNGGRMRIAGGQLLNEGELRVGSSFVGSFPTTTGRLVVTGNGFADTATELLIGRDGQGFVFVDDGSNFVTRGLASLGGESTGQGEFTLGGGGGLATWRAFDEIRVADAGIAILRVSGYLDAAAPGANVTIGAQPGSEGLLLVRGQGRFDTTNPVVVGGTAAAAGGQGGLEARTDGLVTVSDEIKVWDQGTLESDGGVVIADRIATTAGATVRVDGGGSIETNQLDFADGTELELIDGELAVVGPGATFDVENASVAFGSTTGEPTIRLQDVAASVTNWQLGIGSGDFARTVVTGSQGSLFATQALRVGGGIGASNGTLEVLDGATVSAGDDIVLADGLGSTGVTIVRGVAADGSRSLLRKNFGVAPEELVVGRRGTGSLSVLEGGLVQALGNMSIGSRSDGDGTVIVGGASGATPAELSVGEDLAIAGSASDVGPGGAGELTIGQDGSALVGDLTTLYGGGTTDVQAGGRLTTGRLLLVGGALQNDGIVDVGGTASNVSDGELVVADGGELTVHGGEHRFGTLRLQSGSIFDFRDGALNVAGGVLQFPATSYVYGSSTGLPTIDLSDGAVGEVTFVWRVGGNVDTAAQTIVRDPGSRLANTGGGAGADLSIGYEGTGILEVLDGGEVDFNDDVVIAERAGSQGVALVSGVAGGQRARLLARGGTNNDLLVGRAGEGDLTIADGAYVFAADDVAIGSVNGGRGVITVTGAVDGVPSVLEAGDELRVGIDGASPDDDQGAAVLLAFEGGEVIVPNRTLVSSGDEISLRGGTLRTGRLDLGGEPSRFDWQSGVLDLTASGFVVGSTGLLGDALTLGSETELRAEGPIQVVDGGALGLAGGGAWTNDVFSLEDGGELFGEGTLESVLGSISIAGRLRPGNGAGRMTLRGDVSLHGTTETIVEIGGLTAGDQHDQLVVEGTLALDGSLDVSLIDGFTLTDGQEFVIFDVSGERTGAFGGLGEGALVATIGGEQLFLSYQGGDGNDVVLFTEGSTVVDSPAAPTTIAVRAAPNPFNPRTTLALDVPRRAQVEIDVFDVRGALVRRLLTDELEPGRHELGFDGTDSAGQPLASGVYFARVLIDGEQHLRKLTLVR